MRTYFILFSLIITLFSACHKRGIGTLYTPPPASKKIIVSTVAGSGQSGFVNGAILSARFNFPVDLAVKPDGSIYVTDIINSTIRMIDDGRVSSFAGSTDFAIVNGNGVDARFKNPLSIAMDGNGNLYTTDGNDPRIRKITTPDADVSTYAGTGVAGLKNGDADTARFAPAGSICADAQGNIYVSSASQHIIRKISVSGKVTTIAGTGIAGFSDGPVATAQFNTPSGIAVDRQGNLFVIDAGNFRIRKITTAGFVSTLAGNGTNGRADGLPGEAQFIIDTHDIVIDEQGNLYVDDDSRVRKITAQGLVSTIAGSTTGFRDGEGNQALFDFPIGMSIDRLGNIYVADAHNRRIRKISFE